MKAKCLNCGYEFILINASIDELGWHTTCPECSGSFDINTDQYIKFLDRYENACAEKYFEEILYCAEKGYSLGDVDGWISIEEILGKKISFEKYNKVNCELWKDNIDTIGLETDINCYRDRNELIERIHSLAGI